MMAEFVGWLKKIKTALTCPKRMYRSAVGMKNKEKTGLTK